MNEAEREMAEVTYEVTVRIHDGGPIPTEDDIASAVRTSLGEAFPTMTVSANRL